MPKKNQRDPKDALPTTLQEAIVYFADPSRAFEFMVNLRWPDGTIVCPHCNHHDHYFDTSARRWKCKACRRKFSLKTGTIMEDSPLPLSTWLCAMWLISNAKNGVSSYEVHRALGITQKSAWFLLHRIRLAMQRGSLTMFTGTVEADETYIGGKARNMHKSKRAERIKGRGGVGKAIVMGVLERGKDGKASKVCADVIPDTTKETLHEVITTTVEPGSNVYTDTNKSYEGLPEHFAHEKVCHDANEYVRGQVWTNGMENFWSLLKRSIKGTYVSCEPFHLFRYLDEQTFRYNERKDDDRGRFLNVVSSVNGRRLTYKALIGDA